MHPNRITIQGKTAVFANLISDIRITSHAEMGREGPREKEMTSLGNPRSTLVVIL